LGAAVALLLLTGCGGQPAGTPPAFEKSLPAPGTNNVWYDRNDSDTVIVFVHGIISDSRGCWLYRDPDDQGKDMYWPELVRLDTTLGSPSIFLAGYYSKVDSAFATISDSADQIRQALFTPQGGVPAPAASKQNILFITHSTGGIVIRHLLERDTDLFRDKAVGLMLMASPTGGSGTADALAPLIDFYENELGRTLMTGDRILQDIERRFRSVVDDKKLPYLEGIEAFEHFRIVHRRWVPAWFFPKTLLVPRESANRHFGPGRLLEGNDHFGAVKPPSITHPAHRLLVEFHGSKFTSAVERRLANERVVSSDRVETVTSSTVATYANRSEITADRLVIDAVDLQVRPHTVIKANEIAFTNGGRILGSAIQIAAVRILGGSLVADGSPGKPGRPGSDGGLIYVVSRTIRGTTISARGGAGGRGLEPGGQGFPGGRGGNVMIAARGNLDPPPDVSGGTGGEVSGAAGPDGKHNVFELADARTRSTLSSSLALGPEQALAALLPPPAEAGTPIPLVATNTNQLSDDGRRQLDQLAKYLMSNPELGITVTPTAGTRARPSGTSPT
jgi:hypothetical protein